MLISNGVILLAINFFKGPLDQRVKKKPITPEVKISKPKVQREKMSSWTKSVLYIKGLTTV